MGAPFRMVLYAADRGQAESAAQAAFGRVEQLNSILSDYDTDSELSKLSRTAGSGQAVPVSPDLWTVLTKAQRFAELSDGAFDVTVGPCVNLWRKARREQKLPDPKRLEEARAAVGHEKLRLGPARRTAMLLVPDMKLDLGGIAKGYAVDEALKVLKRHGIRRALVAAAGDIGMSDPPPGERGWKITLATLDGSTNAETVLLANAAVSTSGDTFQYLEVEGKRYSHIIDPRTCIGLTDQSLVTIVARDCTTADALATALSVLGPEKGKKLVRQFPGVRARFLRNGARRADAHSCKSTNMPYLGSSSPPVLDKSGTGVASGCGEL